MKYFELEMHDNKNNIHYFRNFELVKVPVTENSPWGYGYKDLKDQETIFLIKEDITWLDFIKSFITQTDVEVESLKDKLKALSKELVNSKKIVKEQDSEIDMLNTKVTILLKDIVELEEELKITTKVKEGLQLAINKLGGAN